MIVSLLVVACLVLAWSARHALLIQLGQLLVSEDRLGRVELIVASAASPAADALEAAALYRSGIGSHIVLGSLRPRPVDEAIRNLGIRHRRPSELAKEILERSGVPAEAISVMPERIDGTTTEIAAVARLVEERRPESVLLIIPRSHTARARYLLEQAVAGRTRVMVRSPSTDSFAADRWWHRRDQSRELVAEYLRWANALMLHDGWSRARATTH